LHTFSSLFIKLPNCTSDWAKWIGNEAKQDAGERNRHDQQESGALLTAENADQGEFVPVFERRLVDQLLYVCVPLIHPRLLWLR
jgi:hypothetical protein